MKTVLQGRYKYSDKTGLTYTRQDKDLLVVPNYLRNHVLRHYHDRLILSKYFWPGIDADVTEHVSTCDICQEKHKGSPGDKNAIKTLISLETAKDFIAGDDWTEFLPLIQWSYNTTPSRMTNHSPQEIIFGQTHDTIPKMPFEELNI